MLGRTEVLFKFLGISVVAVSQISTEAANVLKLSVCMSIACTNVSDERTPASVWKKSRLVKFRHGR